ncbi:MAG: hypothetical protein AMDU3_IPLC00002G0278 [Thermoplasmatales archaeon I-plasma]|nr:MAG: hypothetical protein AMDU3_IPLC00002G0278 [Thermoplasmatales archaeon I-plasma]
MIEPFVYSEEIEISRNCYIFKLETEDVTAYSECVTNDNPFYSYEYNGTAINVIMNYLAKFIADIPQPHEFLQKIDNIKGHEMAKGALEMLLWDYKAKSEKKPLYRILEGGTKGYAETGISIGLDSTDRMMRKVENAINSNYKRIKVKISKGREIDILSSIRDRFPTINLTADANSNYRITDIELLKKIDKFNLTYLEQPLNSDDLIDHAKLRREISTPICLDESIVSLDKLRKAIQVEALDVLNIKPGRVGGIHNSLEIAKMARKNGIHVWVGGMEETSVGKNFNIALASSNLIDYPGDTGPTGELFKREIATNPIEMKDGIVKPLNEFGIGVKMDFEYLDSVTVLSGLMRL